MEAQVNKAERDKRNARIVAAREREPNLTYRGLAQRFDVSPSQAFEAVKKARPDLLVRINGQAKKFDHAAAVEDYRTGRFTYAQLAKKYGVSAAAVHYAIAAREPTLPATVVKTPRKAKFDVRAAYDAYRTGAHTMDSLAADHGVSAAYISIRLNRLDPGIAERVRLARWTGTLPVPARA